MPPEGTQIQSTAAAARLVIYVGDDAELIGAALQPLGDRIALKPESEVGPVLLAAAQARVHAVIVDLSTPDNARALLVAALANAKHPPRVIVIGRRDAVSELLKLPGVYCVIAYPLLPSQIRAAVADRRGRRRNNEAPKEPPDSAAPREAPAPQSASVIPMADFKAPEVAQRHAAWPGWRLYTLGANRFMSVVSTLYKNAAFALLASLFAAFCFYGFLIAYFLLASGWGAPATLTRGHQLVEKAVSDLAGLRVALSINDQRRSEADLEAEKARAAYNDAKVLVDFFKGTIDSEIAARIRQTDAAKKAAARAQKVLEDFAGATPENLRAAPRALYDKRLITKKSYDAQVIGSLDMSQRMAMLETQADSAATDADKLETSIAFLKTIRLQLDGGTIEKVTEGSADLLLLTKQAVDARSDLDQSASQLASAQDRRKLLDDNGKLLRQRIAELEQSAVGRAIEGRIDVIFVPYGNERRFVPGAELYACKLTIFFCRKAGTVGQALPGESTAVHPFFGKPIRGVFVEATLADPNAASQEIIHAGRPPFFF